MVERVLHPSDPQIREGFKWVRPKTEYSPEFRAAALARLATGEPLKRVAREAGIAPNTLRSWASQLDSANRVQPLPTVQSDFRAQLNAEVEGLLLDSIRGLRAIARQAEDAEWRKKQTAADLARLSGTQSADLIRLLSALPDPEPGGRDPHERDTIDGSAVVLPGPSERSPQANS